MSAPTDRFLELLAARTRPPEPPVTAAAPTADFLAQQSVRRYAETLSDLDASARDERLALLADFAAFVDRAPDTMVSEIYNRETRKYRKRGFYSDHAKAWAARLEAPESVRLQRSNLIRAFFIANGFRLPPERPAWMT